MQFLYQEVKQIQRWNPNVCLRYKIVTKYI